MEVYNYQLKHDQDDRIIEKTETVSGKSITWTYAYDKLGVCKKLGWMAG